MKHKYPLGATLLDPNETAGLIPKNISQQAELNEWEQMNILEAESWAFGNNHKDILTLEFIQKLHKRMFDQTWQWAGCFRNTLKNIGVDSHQIQPELYILCKDISYQLKYKTYPLDEMAARLHHRLVSIHPFPNGNGRHARLYTDIFLVTNNKERFSWGQSNVTSSSKTRDTYIQALREADNHNYMPLYKFCQIINSSDQKNFYFDFDQ